jgi:hypothetical protein
MASPYDLYILYSNLRKNRVGRKGSLPTKGFSQIRLSLALVELTASTIAEPELVKGLLRKILTPTLCLVHYYFHYFASLRSL